MTTERLADGFAASSAAPRLRSRGSSSADSNCSPANRRGARAFNSVAMPALTKSLPSSPGPDRDEIALAFALDALDASRITELIGPPSSRHTASISRTAVGGDAFSSAQRFRGIGPPRGAVVGAAASAPSAPARRAAEPFHREGGDGIADGRRPLGSDRQNRLHALRHLCGDVRPRHSRQEMTTRRADPALYRAGAKRSMEKQRRSQLTWTGPGGFGRAGTKRRARRVRRRDAGGYASAKDREVNALASPWGGTTLRRRALTVRRHACAKVESGEQVRALDALGRRRDFR